MLPTGYVNSLSLLLPVIEALAIRHVKVVFQSVLGVDADGSNPYRQVELALEHSGTRHVILRPNWFADNFHTFWRTGIQDGFVAVRIEGRTRSIFEVLLILRGRRIDQRRTDGFRERTSSVLSRSCA
jgi:hypothetical protein